MCKVLLVSRSGYYDWAKRGPSPRILADQVLAKDLEQLHDQHRQSLGALKTWELLRNSGPTAGKHRIARIRKAAGIEARRKRRFRVMTEYQHKEPPAPDLVKRQFMVSAPNRVWVGDMTTLRTREGLLHLAIVLDLFARNVVGWAMDEKQLAALPIAALNMAIARRKPLPGLICHTDQGTQYNSMAYREVLHAHHMKPSMSRKGNCHDNAVAESFFSNLKNELIHHANYNTRREAKAAIFDYIELFYNRMRPHQTLGYKTPAQMEAQYSCA
jgi:putative transposase